MLLDRFGSGSLHLSCLLSSISSAFLFQVTYFAFLRPQGRADRRRSSATRRKQNEREARSLIPSEFGRRKAAYQRYAFIQTLSTALPPPTRACSRRPNTVFANPAPSNSVSTNSRPRYDSRRA